MPLLSRAESQFLRRHLAAARQVTLRRADGCVVRLHLLPPRRPQPDLPFLLLRNGRDLLPLRLSWAILLACWMEAVEPFCRPRHDEGGSRRRPRRCNRRGGRRLPPYPAGPDRNRF